MKGNRAVALTLALDALRQELSRGPKGDPGVRGEKGDHGPEGKKGDRGERGPEGKKGDRGPDGKKGERGERGVEGKKGDRGAKGDQGDRGERGSIGLTPSPDQIYAAVVTYFQNNPVKHGESFDDVEVVRADDGATYKLRFHHTSLGWVDGGNIRVPRPFASGKPVGGGSGSAAGIDGSDDARRVQVTYGADNRPTAVVRDGTEIRYDWSTGLPNSFQYKGVAPVGAPTDGSTWTVWRTTLDAFSRPTLRERRDGVVWDSRVAGW